MVSESAKSSKEAHVLKPATTGTTMTITITGFERSPDGGRGWPIRSAHGSLRSAGTSLNR